mgnify:CR=1 FL=1
MKTVGLTVPISGRTNGVHVRLPMKDSQSKQSCSVRVEASPFLFDSVFKNHSMVFNFLEPPIVAQPAETPERSITRHSETDSISSLSSSSRYLRYRSLPESDFGELKSMLRDYLFGKLDLSKKICLSEREVIILKFLLRKKFFYSHCTQFAHKIEKITAETALQFLCDNPQKKRTQLFKRMIFTKFWKYLKDSGIEPLEVFFNNSPEFDYISAMSSNCGNLDNRFYQKCFGVEDFRKKFVESCNGEQFWEYCTSKAVKTFNLNFEEWARMLDGLHSEPKSKAESRRVLLRVKFMSLDSDPNRIFSLFKLN